MPNSNFSTKRSDCGTIFTKKAKELFGGEPTEEQRRFVKNITLSWEFGLPLPTPSNGLPDIPETVVDDFVDKLVAYNFPYAQSLS